MMSEPTTRDLNALFTMALLLTRQLRLAEDVVLRSIQSIVPSDLSERTLAAGVIKAAARFGLPVSEHSTIELPPSCPDFPAELQNVMRLAPRPRFCYVSRILAGFSSDDCALLLGMSRNDVAAYTSTAALTLSTCHVQPATAAAGVPARAALYAPQLDFA